MDPLDAGAPGSPGIVAVGGGHGLSRALEALQDLGVEPVAVVTVADDGGSSGRLRRDLGIIAPGDLRMTLLTLARNRELAEVLEHRFERGELEGHALGNLLLVAMAEQAGGDFLAALDRAARLLACVGRVLPATADPVQLKARVSGAQVDGQVRVATADGTVERVWLEPSDPRACAEAVDAIEAADVIVLGPGSLFTSVIATVLVPGIAKAVEASDARLIYVCNMTTQPGETTGFTAEDHIGALLDHLPAVQIDAVVLHDGPVPVGPGRALTPSVTHPRVRTVVRADVASRDAHGDAIGAHDPVRLAAALEEAINPRWR